MSEYEELTRAAVRMWTAAEALDAFHDTGDRAWQWTGRQVAKLYEAGCGEDPEAVLTIARVLEKKLRRDRDQVGA